jgi:hypothetical protein
VRIARGGKALTSGAKRPIDIAALSGVGEPMPLKLLLWMQALCDRCVATVVSENKGCGEPMQPIGTAS